MKHASHFENTGRTLVREARSIEAMIADMRRVIQVLDCDVRTEEERSGTFDPSHPHYSVLAKTLAARRDNLKATIAALEARLSTISGVWQHEPSIAA
jgi:ABC-type transporter Mla subunit MlaD